MDLRQFVEANFGRQQHLRRQLNNNNPPGTIDAAEVIVGNYTCRANNSHGSISVSLPIKVTGKQIESSSPALPVLV